MSGWEFDSNDRNVSAAELKLRKLLREEAVLLRRLARDLPHSPRIYALESIRRGIRNLTTPTEGSDDEHSQA
jgi:hypothetical protein